MILEPWVHDLRLAWRGLRRAGAFTAAAVLTLAVGMIGTTVIFALIQGVLLRPLPVAEQNRLIVAWAQLPSTGMTHWPFRVSDVAVIREESRLLERVAGVGYNGAQPVVAVDAGSPTYISSAPVTGEFFDVLGVRPLLGRALTRADDVTGAEGVLVITHGLWQRRYGASHDVIGRRIMLRERPFTIVGVMPPDVEYPRGVEAWTTVTALQASVANPAFRIDVDLIARRRPGATIDQATREVQALTARLDAQAAAGSPRGRQPVVRSYEDAIVGDVRAAILVLFGAVGLVLLIASANAANLLLVRGESRRSELAVRAALGADRIRLVRELLAESILLATAAAAIGLAGAWWALQALVAQLPDGLPRIDAVRIDAGVVLFTTAVAFLAAALAGIAPALLLARADLASELRSGGRGASGAGTRHGRRALVAAQVALAVTVVAAAGLLTRSLLHLQAVDLGLGADRLVFVQLALPHAKYVDRARHLQFLEDVIAQLERAPGIAAATPVNAPPFSGTGGWDVPVFTAEGQSAEQAAANPSLNLEAIHPNYFATLEVTLVRGRAFTRRDRQGAPDVAIVSEDVAARTWPGDDPIGKRIKLGGVASTYRWKTVVGVARSTRYRDLAAPRPTLYLPAEQFLVTAQMIVLRTGSPFTPVASLARQSVHALDPDVLVMRVAPFAEALQQPLARPRFNAFLIALFGIAALLLAAIGVYAVLAAHVRQRDREISIRVALGATASDVSRLVIGEGLRLGALGAAVGLATAVAVTRSLRGLLFEVHPLDPAALAAAALLLIVASALASYLPARRATHVDPVSMLRAE